MHIKTSNQSALDPGVLNREDSSFVCPEVAAGRENTEYICILYERKCENGAFIIDLESPKCREAYYLCCSINFYLPSSVRVKTEVCRQL